MKQLTLSLFLLISLNGNVFAHGDLHERIVKLSQKIDSFPNSAELHFQRGKLYFHHEDYKEAINDLEFSIELEYDDIMALLILAKSHLALDNPIKSVDICNHILSEFPDNVHFNKVLAQSYYLQEEFRLAAFAFEEVLKYSLRTFPENYLDAAKAWYMIESEEGLSKAILTLDNGIAKLGQIHSLLAFQLELYESEEDYENAILVQHKITGLSPRKERAYYRLALLYDEAQNENQAQIHYNLALHSWNELPHRVRSTIGMIELQNKINSSLRTKQ